ncbi:MAG: hypothetical protein R3C17_12945 [Planctomycetaceae bacterium]
MTTERALEASGTVAEASSSANVISWAGVAFALIAAGLYGCLFYMLHKLPASRQQLEGLQTNAPALTRLLVVAASAALLNIVAVILCLTGLFASGRNRLLPLVSAAFSALMLIAVFSVILASLLISPRS